MNLTLRIEKPVAGGRMLARHDGAIVLVAGALPGELVEASVERTQRRTAWATTTRVLEASPHRREDSGDGACGGNVFAHVAYDHQLELKSQIIADAFRRVARLSLDPPPAVRGSAVAGYRMRARLHVRDGRLGFFREGTHSVCDPAPTGQLRADTLAVVRQIEEVVRSLPRAGISAIELAETRDGSERTCHVELRPDGDPSRLATALALPGLIGASCSVGERGRSRELWGRTSVTEVLETTRRDGQTECVSLSRQTRSFFQSNRYLLEDLLSQVLSLVPDGPAVDLYAGVGLFAVPLAARQSGPVLAVEGDRGSASDLAGNAQPFADRLTVRTMAVEASAEWMKAAPADATVIVDPPRTGLSAAALAALFTYGAPRLVYVSCDVATLARDTRALVDGGYHIATGQAFDLFPGTAHVETVLMLER